MKLLRKETTRTQVFETGASFFATLITRFTFRAGCVSRYQLSRECRIATHASDAATNAISVFPGWSL